MICDPKALTPFGQIKDLFGKLKDTPVGQKVFGPGEAEDTAQDLVVRSAANVATIKAAITKAETDYSDTIDRLKAQLVEAEELFDTATKIEAATAIVEQFKKDPESVTKDALYAAMTVLKSHM